MRRQPLSGRKDNIAHLLQDLHFEAVRHDITFPLYVEVDESFNLACPASPIHYQFDPVQTTKTSVIGAINMLGIAKRVKAKILQASTCEVYGDPNRSRRLSGSSENFTIRKPFRARMGRTNMSTFQPPGDQDPIS